jgi:hypothetical protein
MNDDKWMWIAFAIIALGFFACMASVAIWGKP